MSIIVNEDAAHTCISDLGKLGMIQFTDLNPELTAFQRRYVAYIKRIDELERKLSFFGEEVRHSLDYKAGKDLTATTAVAVLLPHPLQLNSCKAQQLLRDSLGVYLARC